MSKKVKAVKVENVLDLQQVLNDSKVATEAKAESQYKDLDGVTIINVTGTRTIASIAKDRNLQATEVFVRVSFEVDGVEYSASNKLGILGKANYEALLAAKANTTPMDITVSDSGFFYINNKVEVADLFAKSKTTQSKNSLAAFFS